MTRMNALTKLNRMYELFTTGDDKKLNPGETEALAGFFRGLTEAGKAKVKERVIEIYQEASYAPGQRDKFMRDLSQAGISVQELEGNTGETGADLARMTKAAQLDRLQTLDSGDSGGGEGFSKDVRKSDVARDAQAAIASKLEQFKKGVQREHHDEAEFGDLSWRAIYREEGANGRGKELMGYAVEVPIYADEHDVDETLYFNVKGQFAGNVYSGE
ncbi:MAG: hypothetical protein AB2A00_24680 [Myxococcota bacterium]